MRVAVVDSQGGGIGRLIIERLVKSENKNISILALGTNAMATAAMLKAGAEEGATGENAIVYNADKVDVIVGSVAILAANSMLGELTPAMSVAIGSSPAKKMLIPLNRCNIDVIGVTDESLPNKIDKLVKLIEDMADANESDTKNDEKK